MANALLDFDPMGVSSSRSLPTSIPHRVLPFRPPWRPDSRDTNTAHSGSDLVMPRHASSSCRPSDPRSHRFRTWGYERQPSANARSAARLPNAPSTASRRRSICRVAQVRNPGATPRLSRRRCLRIEPFITARMGLWRVLTSAEAPRSHRSGVWRRKDRDAELFREALVRFRVTIGTGL